MGAKECPSCRALVEERREFCPSCLASLQPAGAATPGAAAVELAPFPERFPGQQPCPNHPALPIAGSCERCGRFACVVCAPELATREAGLCVTCGPRQPEPPDLRGWLLLVACDVVLSPLGAWGPLTDVVDSLGRWFLTSPRALAVQVAAVVIAAYQVAVAVVFFRRKRIAVWMLIGSYALMVALCVARLLVDGHLGPGVVPGADWVQEDNITWLVNRGLDAVICVPYLLLSQRVKATFVR